MKGFFHKKMFFVITKHACCWHAKNRRVLAGGIATLVTWELRFISRWLNLTTAQFYLAPFFDFFKVNAKVIFFCQECDHGFVVSISLKDNWKSS